MPTLTAYEGSIRGERPWNVSLLQPIGLQLSSCMSYGAGAQAQSALSRRVNPEHLISSEHYGLKGGLCWNALSSTLDQSAGYRNNSPRTAVTLTICPVTTRPCAVDHAPADMVVSFTPGSELPRKRLLLAMREEGLVCPSRNNLFPPFVDRNTLVF